MFNSNAIEWNAAARSCHPVRVLLAVVLATGLTLFSAVRLYGEEPIVRVMPVLDVPTFAISRDGGAHFAPFVSPCFETYAPRLQYFRQFAEAGTKLYSFNTNAAACDYGHSRPTWIDAHTWDYANFDERMSRVLEADPDALVMPRINLGTPRWWLEANPQEMEILDHGDTLYRQPNRNPTLPKGRPFPSVASQKWREDISMALRRFLQHVDESGYNDHIFGYFLAGLDTEEWYTWSSGSDQLLGYSTHMRRAFRNWLREKYADDITLQWAWQRPKMTFDQVEVPSRAERFDSSDGTLRDPGTKMNVIDFYQFYNQIIPQTIDHFARIVKQETGGTKVVGAFYGFMYEFRGDPEYGHNALEQYNESPNLDFIFVTASYGNRQLGTGGDYSRSPAHSVSLHGKLWYHDNDVCSFLAPKVLGKTSMAEDDDSLNSIKRTLEVLGYVDTAEKTKWMYRRALGFALCNGAYTSFFDLHGGYFDHPELMAEVGQLNRVVEEAARYDRSSGSEILVVTDEASCSYATFRSDLLDVSLLQTQYALIKIGAPADHVLINDLDRIDTDPYKLVVFLNNYHMSDQQRELVQKKLKHSGKVLLWCYAPGYFDFNRQSPAYMKELTGLAIVPSSDRTIVAPRIQLVNGEHELHRELAKTGLRVIGPERRCCQLFHVRPDEQDLVLGTFPGSDRAVLVVRDMGDWKSMYAISPTLPPSIYRALARAAGVHIYNDRDDTLYANKNFVAIHANGDGERKISFPWACDIYDAVTQEYRAVNSAALTYDFKNGETLILRWKTRL